MLWGGELYDLAVDMERFIWCECEALRGPSRAGRRTWGKLE